MPAWFPLSPRQASKGGAQRSQTVVQKLSAADLALNPAAGARRDTQSGSSTAADLHAMAEKLHAELEGLGVLPDGELQHKLTRSLITSNCLLMEKEKLEHDIVDIKVRARRRAPRPDCKVPAGSGRRTCPSTTRHNRQHPNPDTQPWLHIVGPAHPVHQGRPGAIPPRGPHGRRARQSLPRS